MPVLPTLAATQAASKSYVLADMKSAFAAIPASLVGPIAHGIQMPKTSSDGRALTWAKLADEVREVKIPWGQKHDQEYNNTDTAQIAGKIASCLAPTSRDDCWGVPPSQGDTAGYIIKKLAKSGERNKHAVHRRVRSIHSHASISMLTRMLFSILFAAYFSQKWIAVLASEATTTAAKDAADAARKTAAAAKTAADASTDDTTLSNAYTAATAAATAATAAYEAAALSKLEIAHLCRRGRYDQPGGFGWGCVNPWHLDALTHRVNLEHNGCARACRVLCPHGNCVWTRKTDGKLLACRLREGVGVVLSCSCGMDCFNASIV